MKRMKKVWLIIAVLALVLALASCEMSDVTTFFGDFASMFGGKETVDPPVLESVYQDIYGNVCATHSDMHDIYNPEFSLDGETWCSTQTSDGVTQLFGFQRELGKFVYRTREGADKTLEVGDTVMIGIREPESADAYATEASNKLTLTLKAPKDAPNLMTYQTLLGENESYITPDMADTTGNNIVYDTASGKYVLAAYHYENIKNDPASAYNCTCVYTANAALATKLEYAFVPADEADDMSFRAAKITDAIKNGTLTFTPFSSAYFDIDKEYVYESVSAGGDKTATMVIRYKETTTTLASECTVADIKLYAVSYCLSGDPASLNGTGSDLELNYDGNGYSAKLVFHSDTGEVSLAALKQTFVLYKTSNYSTGGMDEIANFSVVITGAPGTFTMANAGESYTVNVSLGGQLLFTLPVNVEYRTNAVPSMP